MRAGGRSQKVVGVGIIAFVIGGMLEAQGRLATGSLVIVVGMLILVATGYLWVRRVRQSGTQRRIGQWNKRTERSGGTATFWDHHRRTSGFAMRRRYRGGAVLRPVLRGENWFVRWRVPLWTYSTYIGRSGRRRIWISAEDCLLRVSGTRSGKSTALRHRIRRSPGGVVAASTRVDLMSTLPQRVLMGPCHVYDPAGLWDGSKLTLWTPLAECNDPAVAMLRATDMIPTGGGDEAERWAQQARRVLGVMMHAAALAGQRMEVIIPWLSADGPDIKTAFTEIASGLQASSMAKQMIDAVLQFYSTGDRTRSSIVTSAMPALSWLTVPTAARIGNCAIDESADLMDLIDRQGTLYILGKKDGTTGPLTGALLGEVMRLGEYSAERRGGRLDPPLLMAIDEAAKTCTGPIHQWSADCGGRGIVLDLCTQSLAAVEETWGKAATRMLLTNCNAVLVGAGCKDPDDLAHWMKLSGERRVIQETLDVHGQVISRQSRDVPVVTEAQIAQLNKGECIVYGLGPVTIVRTPQDREKLRG
jgi:type IV secretion system protein VirD4